MHDAVSSRSGPGHPPALYMLFFAAMWERFCFYGMRSLLTLYIRLLYTSDAADE